MNSSEMLESDVCDDRFHPSSGTEILFRRLSGRIRPIALRELLQAAQGLKVSCVYPSVKELGLIRSVADDLKLGLVIDDHKIIGLSDEGKGGWANRASERVALTDPRGSFVVFVAENATLALEAYSADKVGNAALLGELLGYPSCCRTFFCSKWDLAQNCQGDFALLTLEATRGPVPYSGWTNYLAQYFGYALISYFPCSFTCSFTEAYAQSTFNFLSRVSLSFANAFHELQSSAVVYSEYEGVYLLGKSTSSKNLIKYDPRHVRATKFGFLHKALMKGNLLELRNKYEFAIMDQSRVIDVVSQNDIVAIPFR